ncbi:MAG: adenylate cyclase [Polaromonas sp.]|nr:adenylate cyclase [Polaromonas sp.]
MKTHRPAAPRQEEIELKLALPGPDPASLAKKLTRVAVLARRPATRLQVHNIYYDTPGQDLHRRHVALRLRRLGGEAAPEWLQTLKIGGASDSALSRRGEWEVPVPGGELQAEALQATPWSGLDADGRLFQALAPCFVTAFERTRWAVRRQGGSIVEVALDIGQIVAGGRQQAICELELELLAGKPQALFDVAAQIARSIAVLPLNISKAGRGHALLQGTLDLPLRAQPPRLTAGMPLAVAAQQVLREMFGHFTTNLNALRAGGDPEAVHQARVGWRRFKSAWRLFRSALAGPAMPDWQPLRPLLTFVGELRDLDVARTETLPPFAGAYTAGNPHREEIWQALMRDLTQAAGLHRKSVCHALEQPAVGLTLLAITQWLEALPDAHGLDDEAPKTSLRRWAGHRIGRLHQKMEGALKGASDPQSQHQARILAKRLRYGIEAVHPLLSRRPARRWRKQAVQLQESIGAARDVMQAAALAGRLGANAGLAEFLRGVAAGQAGPR